MVKQYIFDEEEGVLLPNPQYIDSVEYQDETEESYQMEMTDFDDVPGGIGSENLQPPDTFTITQEVKNNPNGTTTVDIIVEIQDDIGAQYEVRITSE